MARTTVETARSVAQDITRGDGYLYDEQELRRALSALDSASTPYPLARLAIRDEINARQA